MNYLMGKSCFWHHAKSAKFAKFLSGLRGLGEHCVRIKLAFALLCVFSSVIATATPRRLFDETPAQKTARLTWWTEGRFGMFIHFGLYSLPARGEWVKMTERANMKEEKYQEYFENFNPDLFDAKAWAKAAKAAGMKYAVLTAKHHEGFCLWDTKFTDYKITNTAFKRDLVKEFCEAFRAEGIRVGLYYSLIDWHHPDFTIDARHPRMPPGCRPADPSGTVGGEETWKRINAGKDMNRYRRYMKDQVGELLTNYGRIDIVWFDFTYPNDGGHGKTAEDWDSEGLLKYARSLQPWIIVDNRLGLTDTADGWDFVTPEQFKVEAWPTVNGERVPWETCQTLSGSWGYARDEMTWKTTENVLATLIHSVSKGGNMILNVGPTGRGRFDSRATSHLGEIGEWMKLNSRAIYGCTEAPEQFKAPENTVLTFNPATRRLYIHLLAYPGGRIACPFAADVAYAQFLHDASEITLERHGTAAEQTQEFYKSGNEGVSYFLLPAVKPDVLIPVIEVILKPERMKQ